MAYTRSRQYTLLHEAAFNGDTEAVKTLLSKKGVDINARDDAGRTETVRTLVANGADIGAKDKEGRTPLDYTRIYMNGDATKALQAEIRKRGSEPDFQGRVTSKETGRTR